MFAGRFLGVFDSGRIWWILACEDGECQFLSCVQSAYHAGKHECPLPSSDEEWSCSCECGREYDPYIGWYLRQFCAVPRYVTKDSCS